MTKPLILALLLSLSGASAEADMAKPSPIPRHNEQPLDEPWWQGLPPNATPEDTERLWRDRLTPDARREMEEFEREPEETLDRLYREHFDRLEQQRRMQKMMKSRSGTDL